MLLALLMLMGQIHRVHAARPHAWEKGVLLVPGSQQPLCIGVALPASAVHSDSGPWQLVEDVPAKTTVPVLVARDPAATGEKDSQQVQLLATIPAAGSDAAMRRFHLLAVDGEQPGGDAQPGFHFAAEQERTLLLLEGKAPRLAYNFGTMTGPHVPKDDPRRRRSCYIHPLWGIHGEVLTDDFPPDHYHHHGLFWTWPHVKVGDQSYDLWLGRGIRQKFVRWLGRAVGRAGARLGVENRWVIASGSQVMCERVWLNVYPTRADRRIMDLYFNWIPSGQPVTLQGAAGKSYGGLTLRFAVKNPAEATITIPSGVAPEDLPDTALPWADLTTTLDGQTNPSGAALFVPPDHPDFPPTWLLRHYGPLCIGWPGVRAKTFPAGQPIHLHYRVWIHDGQPSAEQIGQAYQAYTLGLQARWLSPQDQDTQTRELRQ